MIPEQAPQKIADMITVEKLAAMTADPEGYLKRACEDERPRAEQQVNHRLQRLRQLGRESLTGSET